MNEEIIGKIVDSILADGGFMWGFLVGSILTLVFRETIVRFLIAILLKRKNGKLEK